MARVAFSLDFFEKVQELSQVPDERIFWTVLPEKDKQVFPLIVITQSNVSRSHTFGGGRSTITYTMEINVYDNDPVEAEINVAEIMQRLSDLDGYSGELGAGGTKAVLSRQDFATVVEDDGLHRGITTFRLVIPA